MCTPRWRRLILPFALLPITGMQVSEARAETFGAAAERISGELKQVWSSDPLTRGLSYPMLQVLAADVRALELCPEARRAGASPSTSALYCPSSGKVLLDRKWLEGDVERDGDWPLAYWIATALAEAIRQGEALPGPALTGAAANLQATCMAGLLLHQSPSLWPSEGKGWDTPAFKAYSSAEKGTQGTPAQRSYAFLSGMGSTASSCSSKAMAALVEGAVNLISNKAPQPPMNALEGATVVHVDYSEERDHGSEQGAVPTWVLTR
jgi:hypothetical protein